MMKIKRKIFFLSCFMVALLFSQGALAFIGEEGFAFELLELMLRKNFVRVVEEIASSMKVIYYERFPDLVKMNPDPLDPGFSRIMGYLTTVVGALYFVAIVSFGIYLIYFSGSPGGRSTAKAMIRSSFIGMIFVILSPYIIGFILSFSHDRTNDILNLWPGNPMSALGGGDGRLNAVDYFASRFEGFSWASLEGSLPFMLILLIIVAGTLGVVMLRYLAVSFFMLVLPLTIFFYSFHPTRGVGRRMLEQTLLWTFSQVAEAMALVLVAYVVSFTPESDVRIITVITGAFVILIVPLAIVGFFRDFIP